MVDPLSSLSSASSATRVAPRGPAVTPREDVAEDTSIRAAWLTCGALVAIAALFHLYLLHTVFAHIDSDQAVVGLMAYHIQAGDRPVFYDGQPYQGSLEAYLAALVFSVLGANEWTIRLPALAFSIAFVGAVYWLGITLYGRWIAVLAGLFVALGPALLSNWSTAVGFSYIEVMVCGTLLLLLAVRYPDPRAMPLAVALAWGVLAGIGMWIQPMMGEYLVPLAVAFALRLLAGPRDRSLSGWLASGRSLATILVGAGIGSAPLLVYNMRHGWATLSFLHPQASGGDHLAVAGRLITQSAPVLLGLVTPTTVGSVFARLIATHPVSYGAGVLVGAGILVRLVFDLRGLPLRIVALAYPPCRRRRIPLNSVIIRGHHDERGPCDGALALFAVSCLLFFVFTHFGAMPWATRSPRYLLPLYTITPLVLDVFIPRHPGRLDRWTAALAVSVLIAAGLTTTLTTEPRPAVDGLTRLLETRHIRVAYTTYWLANRIAFATHEQVLGVPVADDLTLGQERLPSYLALAAHTPTPYIAWIFAVGGPGERHFRQLMQHAHIRAHRTPWENLIVYDTLSKPLRVRPL